MYVGFAFTIYQYTYHIPWYCCMLLLNKHNLSKLELKLKIPCSCTMYNFGQCISLSVMLKLMRSTMHSRGCYKKNKKNLIFLRE